MHLTSVKELLGCLQRVSKRWKWNSRRIHLGNSDGRAEVKSTLDPRRVIWTLLWVLWTNHIAKKEPCTLLEVSTLAMLYMAFQSLASIWAFKSSVKLVYTFYPLRTCSLYFQLQNEQSEPLIVIFEKAHGLDQIWPVCCNTCWGLGVHSQLAEVGTGQRCSWVAVIVALACYLTEQAPYREGGGVTGWSSQDWLSASSDTITQKEMKSFEREEPEPVSNSSEPLL